MKWGGLDIRWPVLVITSNTDAVTHKWILISQCDEKATRETFQLSP